MAVGVTCTDIHWRLVELGVDHACGLASLLRAIGNRLGIFDVPNVIDVMVYGAHDTVKSALGSYVVVERSLVPELSSRAILIGGVPYASIEDLIVSVVVNTDTPWYVELVRELLMNDWVRGNLRWEWVNEVLSRFGVRDVFNRVISH